MDNGRSKVKIGEHELAVSLPDFAAREELLAAWGEAARPGGNTMACRRVAAAAIGLCTNTGKRAKADYGACRCDVLVYGGRIYGWLHEQGVDVEAILSGGVQLIEMCAADLYPRASEVEAKADFFDRAPASSTA